ncbi:hypothetical protein KSP40_PGU018662 [Platanthera guangdongensis]|uniref:MADS-box domain-containing protein n=1 Tax=Platanthera guangdongensis TaxID=2320717 RepID=A0ABR2LJY4_9ASPA
MLHRFGIIYTIRLREGFEGVRNFGIDSFALRIALIPPPSASFVAFPSLLQALKIAETPPPVHPLGGIAPSDACSPIVNAKRRQACFSKLLPGLFKKVAELRNLGVEVAIIVFSPSGTPFLYGYPSTFEALGRFLNDGAATFETSPSADDRSGQIKRDLEYWGGLLEAQKKLRRQMKAVLKDPRSRPNSFWWDADIKPLEEIEKPVAIAGTPGTGRPDTEHGAEECFKGSRGGL